MRISLLFERIAGCVSNGRINTGGGKSNSFSVFGDLVGNRRALDCGVSKQFLALTPTELGQEILKIGRRRLFVAFQPKQPCDFIIAEGDTGRIICRPAIKNAKLKGETLKDRTEHAYARCDTAL